MVTRIARTLWPALLLAMLAGCATVDFDYPKTPTTAIPAEQTIDTEFGRLVQDLVAAHPEGESGFHTIYGGIDALALRLILAERAEHTIDAQYYLIYDDIIGRLFIDALLRAANRGVRVRFLLDDFLSMGLDPGLAAFASHPNVEVRIFNPFAYRKARFMDIFRLGRMTRRMHNKSFTIDNQISILGGRNIAAEYFDARPDEHFNDLDVLAIGPIVPEVSEMFDTYWNYRTAVPIEALSDVPDDAEQELATLGERVRKSFETADTSAYADAVRQSVVKHIEADSDELIWAQYDLVYDSPDKIAGELTNDDDKITTQMRTSIGEVKDELVVVSPYFVLLKEDVEGFVELRERGIDVTVLTNGLASNNHSSVHGGYKSARKPLIRAGVGLYEFRASLEEPADKRLSRKVPVTTLHAKTFTVDGESAYIGSFNWNQRSANRDTEVGVIIHSAEIASDLNSRVADALVDEAFQVTLDESNRLRWTIQENGEEVTLKAEPQASLWKRFGSSLIRILPIKSQL